MVAVVDNTAVNSVASDDNLGSSSSSRYFCVATVKDHGDTMRATCTAA